VEKLAPLAMEAQARNRWRRHFRSRGLRKAAVECTREQRRGKKADEPSHDSAEAPWALAALKGCFVAAHRRSLQKTGSYGVRWGRGCNPANNPVEPGQGS
jgi:hypothetical protein